MAQNSSAQESFYALIGRALIDEEYRERVIDPERQADALAEVLGRKATSDDVAALQRSIAALNDLYGRFGPRPYSA